MSLYPPSTSYGQMSYPQQGYMHRAPPTMAPPYQYQPPPPVYHMDPNSFREDYLHRLSMLNVNSRPLIQSLSMIAQEQSRWAEIVAQCIETHIRRASPWMKLPAFYLLDAISKNVYEPYARHFTPFVIPLFLETYEQVDQSTRSKMEEMLLTWRSGAPNGKELFGVGPQVSIERAIWGGGDSGYGADSSRAPRNGGTAAPVSKAQVLSELDFTLSQRERSVHQNPYDTTAQNHVNVLRQLRSLVEAGVSQDELREVLNQLRALTRTMPPPAVAQPPSYQTPPPQPSVPQYPPAPAVLLQPTAYGVAPSQPSYPQQPSYSTPSTETKSWPSSLPPASALLQSNSAPAPVPAAAPVPVVGPSSLPLNNIENLFSALVKAGVVSSNNGRPVGAGATAKAEDVKSGEVDPARQASRDYRQAVLSQKIKLTNADITKQRPQVVPFLYDRLSSQCKQCGLRFSDNSIGKKKLEEHLDMHFRQNRKASQNVGRGHSRSWFIGVEDWIHEISDSKGKGRADRRLTAKETAAAAAKEEEAVLRASHVVVPPGDEAKPISCPICKETLPSEFLEDEEEWVWKNAVKKDDRIYHATCLAEAVKSNRVAALLLSEKASRSRSVTPDRLALRTTPPRGGKADASGSVRIPVSPSTQSRFAGTKRKADDPDSPTNESGGTPPMKKMTISTAA
ncbi:hypothetical protein OE88DRAFT_1652537 [Heliocybe sulcata]|uniref:CID domain-containing protein n=1 Tax=Heliocybe sulcata TaxID=5364 RepID=A0A5C3NF52_9AGAM|nr:hypothetical protein OE88DRAFT_1652537 [Heliocybe sulcata]